MYDSCESNKNTSVSISISDATIGDFILELDSFHEGNNSSIISTEVSQLRISLTLSKLF